MSNFFLHPSAADPALRRLEALSTLDDADREVVRRLAGRPTDHRIGADLGDDSDESCRFLVSGWACRMRTTPWGGRQILDLLVPGDAVGWSIHPPPEGLYRILALTHGITVDAIALRDAVRADEAGLYHRLRRVAEESRRVEACRLLDHTIRVCSKTAYQALAHLLLELRDRLATVGLIEGGRCPLPLTQDHLANVLGIGQVQVNRILGQMRREGLVALGSGWIDLPDLAALAAAAGLPR